MFIAACAVSLLAGLSSAHATPARVEALQQVNRDIWEPFTRGVATFDDPAWLGVRSRDFVMVQQGKPHFLGHDFYVEDSTRVMRELKQAGTRLALELLLLCFVLARRAGDDGSLVHQFLELVFLGFGLGQLLGLGHLRPPTSAWGRAACAAWPS